MDNSIAEQIFTQFYDLYKKDGRDNVSIIYNLLPEFIDEAMAAWGYSHKELTIATAQKIEGERALFQAFHNQKYYVISDGGNIYTARIKHEKTGGQTWNGDDEFYENYNTFYTNIEKVDSMQALNSESELTIEIMENLACEMISIIFNN